MISFEKLYIKRVPSLHMHVPKPGMRLISSIGFAVNTVFGQYIILSEMAL